MKLILLLCLLLSVQFAQATHLSGGYIQAKALLANRSSCENIPTTDGLLVILSTTFSTNTNALNQTPTASLPQSGSYVGVNQRTVIPLAARDSEGDSLAYGLARPYTSTNVSACDRQTVTAYQFPNDLIRLGLFKLSSRTGELIWDAPVKEDRYCVALNIDEYRNGVLISQTPQELLFIVADLVGTPSTIPAYEPAIEGKIVIATANLEDADLLLTVFPNPVDDRLQVVIQTSNPATATVRLFDPNGRKLHELTFSRLARQHEQVISLNSLTPGIYVVRANIDGRLLQRKVVKR